MPDRLRILLDHPLERGAARAIVVLSSAILLGLAALLVLADGEPDRPQVPTAERPLSADSPPPGDPVDPGEPRMGTRQDPQDVPGSAAARRASRAIRSHRALQHVPYRDGELGISLIGARGSRAVLRVSAPTARAARRGWRRFLRRFEDPGSAYIPVFAPGGRVDG